MMHWRAISGASVLVLGLAVAPVQAQTSASSHKSLLEQNPSPGFVQAELNRIVYTLRSDLGEPLVLPPSAPQPPSPPSSAISGLTSTLPASSRPGASAPASSGSGSAAPPPANTPSQIAGLISAMIGVPQNSVPVPQTAQQGGANSFNTPNAVMSAARQERADAAQQQSAGNATQDSFANHPANATATSLRAWQLAFAADHSDVLGTTPDWGSLPVDLQGSYSGSALAIMPNGSSLTGSMSMDLQLQLAPTFQYHSFRGEVDFGQAGLVPLSAMFVSGVELPTVSAFAGHQAFGGNLVGSSVSGAFHGSQADVFRGTWSATISDGPNAGVVNGHLGGAVQ
jgi:hypothetical protein